MLRARNERSRPGAADFQPARPSSPPRANLPAPTRKVTCYRCSEVGHYANECPQGKTTPANRGKNVVKRISVKHVEVNSRTPIRPGDPIDGPQTLVPICVNGQMLMAQLDTGASRSFISASLAAKVGATIEPRDGSVKFANPENTVPRIGVTSPMRIQYGPIDTTYQCEVLEKLEDAQFLLGSDLINCVKPDYSMFRREPSGTSDDAAQASDAPTPLVPPAFNAEKEPADSQRFRGAVARAIEPELAANLVDWPVPTTAKQLQSFLGFVNYLRDFVPKLSTITAPLNAIRLKDNIPEQWTPECAHAFQLLKEIIPQCPPLAHPDFARPFYVATDASAVGIGCVLYQLDDNTNAPQYIQFQARALRKSECNYSATKRELLAIVFALARFRHFIYGRHFTLYTDHHALAHLRTQPHLNAMMQNWYDEVRAYDFDAIHRPGIHNILPDRLSRLYPQPKAEGGGASGKPADNKHNARKPAQPRITVRKATTTLATDQRPLYTKPPSDQRPDIIRRHRHRGHLGVKTTADSLARSAQNATKSSFNAAHARIDIPIGAHVMVRDNRRRSKLNTRFKGPFEVIRKSRGKYTLRDNSGALLPHQYLIRWKHDSEDHDSGEPASNFDDETAIVNYWKRRKQPNSPSLPAGRG